MTKDLTAPVKLREWLEIRFICDPNSWRVAEIDGVYHYVIPMTEAWALLMKRADNPDTKAFVARVVPENEIEMV